MTRLEKLLLVKIAKTKWAKPSIKQIPGIDGDIRKKLWGVLVKDKKGLFLKKIK